MLRVPDHLLRHALIRTHLPLKGSLAIGNAVSVCPANRDQRGVARPQCAICDIGAVEVQPGDPIYRLYLPVVVRNN